MVVLRCTRKLLRHLPGADNPAREPPRSTGVLGDWYANLFIARRQHLVLAVSGRTLLPVLLPAPPYKTLCPRLAEDVAGVLRQLGVGQSGIAAEAGAMQDWVLAPTNDRRVLGSMNDFANMLESYLDGRSLTEVALHLAEALCSPLRMESPRAATIALFTAPMGDALRGRA